MSIAPYGYTLTVWTSGAILTHARGVPSSVDALLFMLGAVAGFGLVALVAFGDLRLRTVADPPHPHVWGGLHLLSIGLAIGAATLNARLVENIGAWPIGGFLATAIYLLTLALQLGLAG
jgi:hypothetical protein